MKKMHLPGTLLIAATIILVIISGNKSASQSLTGTHSANKLQDGGTKTPPAALLWDGDAAIGKSVWKVLDIDSMGSISAVTDASAGTVWKFYKPLNNHRTEGHAARGYVAEEGSDIYIGWRSKLDMPANVQTNAIFQWKAYGGNMQQNFPIVIKTLSTGSLQLQHYAPGKIGTNLWTIPLNRNVWNDFVMHLKVSRDATVGFIEFWYNGVQQTFNGTSTRFYGRTLDAGYCDPKWGVYGADAYTITNYVGVPRVGSAYADVAPAK